MYKMKYIFSFVLLTYQLPFLTFAQNIDSFEVEINACENDSCKSAKHLILAELLLRSELNKCLKYSKKSLDYAQKANNSLMQLKALNLIGNYYQRTSNNDSALLVYNDALDIAKANNDTKGYAIVYNNIAIVYTYQGKFEEAIDLYLKALKAEEELDNLQGIAQAYNNIAVVYYQTRNFAKTIDYLNRATKILEQLGDEMNLKKTLINIGAIHTYNAEHQKAIDYFQRAYVISKKLNDKREMSIALSNLTDCYISLKDYDKAEATLNEALAIKKEENNLQGIIYEYENFAKLHKAKNELKIAETYFVKALKLGLENRFLSELRDIYKIYSEFLKEQSRYDEAYTMLEKSNLYNDSLINQSSAEKIAELETKYETVKKEQTILEQENEIAENELEIAKRNRWIISLSSTALIVLFIALFIVQRNKRKAQAEKDAAVIHERDEGIKAIFEATETERKRIAGDLHDGIGQQLSGLKMAFSKVSVDIKDKLPAEHDKINKLTSVLDDTCAEVRSISHAMMPKSLGEFGLVQAIDDMLNKSLNLTDIEFEFEHHGIDTRFAENIELSLYRVCQELINNVVKHSGAAHVVVQLYKANKRLILLVEDNGKGIDEKKDKDGIGLKNMNSRINSVNGEINFEPSPESGTLATVRIPIP